MILYSLLEQNILGMSESVLYYFMIVEIFTVGIAEDVRDCFSIGENNLGMF